MERNRGRSIAETMNREAVIQGLLHPAFLTSHIQKSLPNEVVSALLGDGSLYANANLLLDLYELWQPLIINSRRGDDDKEIANGLSRDDVRELLETQEYFAEQARQDTGALREQVVCTSCFEKIEKGRTGSGSGCSRGKEKYKLSTVYKRNS